MIKVLLADDHSIMRAGLRRIIEESDDIEVIAEADDGKAAIQLAREKNPDVAVVDISMPGLDGLEVISQLKIYLPDLPIIRSAPEHIVKAIHQVLGGTPYLTAEASEALALRIAKGASGKSTLDSLSTRELQVLRRLAMGHTNHEIATAYGISTKTVDTYRLRLLKKLNLRNNAELSRFAIQNKLIET
jgi:DNA-binding NarL/FixJ family response regulator